MLKAEISKTLFPVSITTVICVFEIALVGRTVIVPSEEILTPGIACLIDAL